MPAVSARGGQTDGANRQPRGGTAGRAAETSHERHFRISGRLRRLVSPLELRDR